MKKQKIPVSDPKNAGDDLAESAEQSNRAEAADAEALIAENAELRAELRSSQARGTLLAALTAAGARTPGLLLEAADMPPAEGDVIIGTESVVGRLKTKFPEQFRSETSGSIDGGAGRNAPAPLTKEALAKMTPAQIAKLDWAVVRSVLSEK